jgi:hypothetical protein
VNQGIDHADEDRSGHRLEVRMGISLPSMMEDLEGLAPAQEIIRRGMGGVNGMVV